jgi:hypothetical protein
MATNTLNYDKVENVNINSHIYNIKESKTVMLDGESVDGLCDYSNYQIQVALTSS